MVAVAAVEERPALLKIDLGCGPHRREGFLGCDQYSFDGKVDHVFDIGTERWPFEDESVGEAQASHFVEHLTPKQRCHFVNELCRVLVPLGTCQIITPHWASNRAYGDPTHEWPPVSEMWYYYLKHEWRMSNAPHTDATLWPSGFSCDFDATWGYNMHQMLHTRNQEYQQFALSFYKEAALDLMATLTKREVPKEK